MNKAFGELKKRGAADLQKEMAAAQLELVKQSAQLAMGGAAKEAGKIKNLKKRVARISTLLTEKGREQ